MEKRFLTHLECLNAAFTMAKGIQKSLGLGGDNINIYPVPRGGVPVAYLLRGANRYVPFIITMDPSRADAIVDDIIDSGATQDRYCEQYKKPFYSLVSYLATPREKGQWIVFPWEVGEKDEDRSSDDIVLRLLQFVGEDTKREGLQDTPKRVLKAWKEWTAGYGQDPAEILKVFKDGSEAYNEMVVVKDIPFYSHCEHHLAPFFGTATVSYIPNGKIVGLSKLSRLVDVFARRLQVQERLTCQIADALHEHLVPKGVGVVLRARHLCMESRGISQQGHQTITSALRGQMSEGAVRNEFLSLVQ